MKKFSLCFRTLNSSLAFTLASCGSDGVGFVESMERTAKSSDQKKIEGDTNITSPAQARKNAIGGDNPWESLNPSIESSEDEWFEPEGDAAAEVSENGAGGKEMSEGELPLSMNDETQHDEAKHKESKHDEENSSSHESNTGTGGDSENSDGANQTGSAPSQGSTTAPSQGSTTSPSPVSSPSDSQMAAECSRWLGVPAKDIHISGSSSDVTLNSFKGMVIKVSGNQNKVQLNLRQDSNSADMGGLCIFTSGNRSQVSVNITGSLGALVIKGSGNQGLIDVRVGSGSEIQQSSVTLSGNQSKVTIGGEGELGCSKMQKSTKGKGTQVTCGN